MGEGAAPDVSGKMINGVIAVCRVPKSAFMYKLFSISVARTENVNLTDKSGTTLRKSQRCVSDIRELCARS